MKLKNYFRKKVMATAFLLVAFIFSNFNYAQQVRLESHKKMNVDALHFWYSDPSKPVALFNRDISPKGDCIKVVNGYVFFTWYKGGMQDRNLMLSRRKIGSDNWVTIQFPDKNTLYTTEYQGINYANSPGGDSHRTTSVGISQIDGTIHLAYDTHSGEMNYRISKKNIAFAPDANFTLANFNPKRNYLKAGQVVSSFTYPHFSMNDAGELILDFRIGGTRRGNLMMAYYDGNVWSTSYVIVNGRDPNPTYNLYGELKYEYGKMYLGGSLRIMNSPISYNQGFYFGIGGQRGNEPWKTKNGATNSVPLTSMAPYKIAEPLPPGSTGMTSGPSFTVAQNGAVHFANRVPGQGTVHYYKTAGSTNFVKGPSGGSDVSFAAGGRVYGIDIYNGNIRVKSTLDTGSNWRTDYTYDATESFGIMAHQYYNGKLYIVASEDRNSDKRPLHHIVIDLGITTTPPANQAPIVSFRTPSTNLTVNVGYNLAVEAIANDSDGSINNVKLYINNSFIRQENAAPYTWGQPNTELNGRDPGTYTIKAVATDNQGATGEKSFVLTVNNTTSNVAVSSVSLSPPTVNLTIGQSRQLTHAISPTNATNRNVTFTSSNTNIATVSNTGLVRAVANGNTTITIKTADGNKTDTSVVTVARSTLNTCAFGTPRTSALPSTNTSYTKMYVLGNGGPTISNFRELQVNWDARYNGLYVFAFSTTNGVPDWYNDLKPRITQNFNVSSPSITISNSGISGLDGAYWVTKNGADFAMVSKTQGYTLYFSTSTTAPSCGITAREAEPKDLVVYPNPAKESITISKELALGTKITISDMQGIVLIQRQIDSKDTKIEVSKLHAGMYVLLIETKYTVEKTIFNIID